MARSNLSMLITGAGGQLARCLADIKPADINLHLLDKSEFNIADTDQIDAVFENYDFDFIVNCAAFTNVDLAESRRDEAYTSNAEAVRRMASACSRYDKTLIQISSDYVYDNGINRPLVESDDTQPKSVYASSKLQGDIYALEENPKTIILRTSWLYSEFGKNFVKTMLRLGREKTELRVVADQHGIPTYARDLAHAIYRIALSDVGTYKYGIYHFANTGPTTWSEFAACILEKSGIRTPVIRIATTDYPTPANRPLYSVLDSAKFSREFAFEIRHWHDALDECLTRMAMNANANN